MATAAQAARMTLDPATCAADAEGKVYFRLLTGYAFALPANSITWFGDYAVGDPAPDADLSQPKGCPDNPIVTGYFTFPHVYDAAFAGSYEPELPDEIITKLRVFALPGLERLLRINLELFNRLCHSPPDFGETLASGLIVCRPPRRDGWAMQDLVAYYMSPLDVHPTGGGLPYVLHCPRKLGKGRHCRADYRLEHGLWISYEFIDDVIKEDDFLNLDREIRRQIMAARVPELDWVPDNAADNPDGCATDPEGMVYMRLPSGLALRFPAGDMDNIWRRWRESQPPVPDSSRPEGCPGNPIDARNFHVIDRLDASRYGKPEDQLPDWAPDFLNLFGYDGPPPSQKQWIERYQEACRKYDLPETFASGLMVCRFPHRDDQTPLDRGAFYVAPLDVHPAADGIPFAVHCVSRVGPGRKCRVEYELRPGLIVMYHFNDHRIPEDDFLDADLEIRRLIMDARVPALDWAPGATTEEKE